MNPTLISRLGPVADRYRRLQLWRRLALCWLAAALIGLALVILKQQTAWSLPYALPGLTLAALAAATLAWWRTRNLQPDIRWLAARIEHKHPELHALLLTAVEQQARDGGELNFLQDRVLQQAIAQARHHDWSDTIPSARLAWAEAGHLAALLFLGITLLGLRSPQSIGLANLPATPTVVVTPGDTSLERGSSLIVLARFNDQLPPGADLVLAHPTQPTRRFPLTRSLADPVFGGSVPNVETDFLYHVAYGSQRTPDFHVSVFEYPRLERSDAELTYPQYTGLTQKRIEGTRRLTAVEGTRLNLALSLNKPVAAARLIAKDHPALELETDPARALARLRDFPLAASQTYHLQLVDADGRTNKIPASFIIAVLKNRPPELKLASPRGDLRPSPLEEIAFSGTVWDDFGLVRFGLSYTLAGQQPRSLELGQSVPGTDKRSFQYLLRLEDLGVHPDQLLAYHVWTEDVGPDGQTRRTLGDMYFAEIRPFEEIFRQSQGGDGQQSQEQQSGESGQPNSPAAQLAELQKQVINATWNLQRQNRQPATPDYQQDAHVVRDGQAQARAQAEAAAGQTPDPRSRILWNDVTREMDRALIHLDVATNSPASLPPALAAEQSAYQALLKLQAREYEVARSRSQSRSQNQSEARQRNQRQLDQLDLTDEAERYETQREAQAPQNPERREQLQVLNRLQELARRQQDLNDRLQELQTALQEAQTEAERDQIRRELKRLSEQEQQMLADLDELRQRMDQPENQSRMTEQRRQLDQVRDDLQRAAEATQSESVSQALAAGTRAERQLQEMRDELRRQSASQFAEDMRQMRQQARQLARQQDAIARDLDALRDTERRALSDSAERQDLARQLANQKQQLTNLVDHAAQISDQAEPTEPRLSRQLYDAVRDFNQQDARTLRQFRDELLEQRLMSQSLYNHLRRAEENERARSLELTAEMLRQNYLPQADRAEEAARAGISRLAQGVERAAQSVVGDDTEALRLARDELERLTDQLNQEIENAAADSATSSNRTAQAAAQPAQQPGGATPDANPPQIAAAGQESTGTPAQPQPGADPAPSSQPPTSAAAPPNQPGQPEAQTAGNSQPGSPTQPRPANGRQNGQSPGPDNPDPARPNPTTAGGDTGSRQGRWRNEINQLLNNELTVTTPGPLTGETFTPWSDGLREVEEMLEEPQLRNDIATARERARAVRLEFNRSQKKPDWAVVQLDIVNPLVEVHQRITEELARRESTQSLVPIDRDPVPTRFSELVRRYYEELGKSHSQYEPPSQ